jgi:hypothetical protein
LDRWVGFAGQCPVVPLCCAPFSMPPLAELGLPIPPRPCTSTSGPIRLTLRRRSSHARAHAAPRSSRTRSWTSSMTSPRCLTAQTRPTPREWGGAFCLCAAAALAAGELARPCSQLVGLMAALLRCSRGLVFCCVCAFRGGFSLVQSEAQSVPAICGHDRGGLQCTVWGDGDLLCVTTQRTGHPSVLTARLCALTCWNDGRL